MIIKILRQPTQFLINTNFTRSLFETKCLFQSQDQAKPNSSNLFKLRKSTGYALNKCKEALEKHAGNIEEATKWLNEQAQKEGWTKAEKLKNRQTSQGTLVFYTDKSKNQATLVELNCETDFVARNEKFLDLSSQLAKSVLQNFNPTSPKSVLSKEDLNKISFIGDSTRTIGDQVALAIGSLGENMSLRRAVVFNLGPDQHLGWYMHGSASESLNNCHFGKYGALVNLSFTQKNEDYKPFDIGRQIAQHIVGMKPQSLGEVPKEQALTDEPIKIDDNETKLLFQEFLMKPNTRVLEFLNENHAQINDFVRLECGEVTENEAEQK